MLSPTMMLFTWSCFLQVDILAMQFLRFDRVLDQDQSLFEGKRFFQEVVGAQLGGAHRGLDRSVAGDHDDFGRIVELANLLQSFEAVHAGKPDIEQDHIERGLAQELKTRLATSNR